MANSFGGGIRFKRGKLPPLHSQVLPSASITLTVSPSRSLLLSKGDRIGRGGLVAAPVNGAAAVYSGISGIVTEIEEAADVTTVVITRDDALPGDPPLPPVEERLANLSEEALKALLLERGVTPPPKSEKTLQHLIIDCSGDDPYNESRGSLCLACAGDVVGGAKILMKLLTVRQAVFVVSKDHRKVARELMSYMPAGSKMLTTALVGNLFPQAEPRLLVSSLFDVEIHSSTPLTQTGYAVVSPLLCKASFDALAKGIPFTDVAVTVTEEPLSPSSQRVLTVPIGTAFSELLFFGGNTLSEQVRLTVGGGYRALPARPADTVASDTEALSLLRVKSKRRLGICIGCGRCGHACPIRLSPAILYEAAITDRRKAALRLDLDACLGCGTCTAACPAGIPLAETITAYRAALVGDSDEG